MEQIKPKQQWWKPALFIFFIVAFVIMQLLYGGNTAFNMFHKAGLLHSISQFFRTKM